jgi:hypothetical protein
MGSGGERLGAIAGRWPRVSAGMRELQTDAEIPIGVCAEGVSVRGDEVVAQPSERRLCRRRE